MIAIMSDWLIQLFSGSPQKHHARGEPLFRAGDPVKTVLFVVSGQVDLIRTTATGNELVLLKAGPGDIVAEASVYSEQYHCEAIARSESLVATLPVKTFKDALADNRTWSELWAARLAHSVQKARMCAEVRSLKRVSERLDFWLADNEQLPQDGHLQDVASEISVSREALYRELARRRSPGK